MFGKSVSQIVGRTDRELNSNDGEVDHFEKADAELLQETTVKHMFHRSKTLPPLDMLDIDGETLTDALGTTHELATHKERVIAEDGSIKIVGVSVDMTEFAEAKAEAQRVGEVLRSVINSAYDEVYVKQVNTGIIKATNDNLAKAWGFETAVECVGQKHTEIGKLDEVRLARDLDGERRSAESGGVVTEVQWLNRSEHAGPRYRITRYIPLPSTNEPEVVAVTNFSAIPTGEDNLQEIVNTLPQCLFFKDIDFKFRFWNRSFASWHNEAVGFTDFEGLSDFELWAHDREQADRYRRDDEEVVKSGKPVGHWLNVNSLGTVP